MTTAVLATIAEAELRAKKIRAGLDKWDAVAESLGPLLAEAKESEDWRVLGYSTWEEYTVHCLGISRRRSYQLLDQVRINAELSAETGTPVELSERATREVRRSPELKADVVASVKAGIEATPAYQRALEEQRAQTKLFATDPKLGKAHRGYAPPQEQSRVLMEKMEQWAEESEGHELADPLFERNITRIVAAGKRILGVE